MFALEAKPFHKTSNRQSSSVFTTKQPNKHDPLFLSTTSCSDTNSLCAKLPVPILRSAFKSSLPEKGGSSQRKKEKHSLQLRNGMQRRPMYRLKTSNSATRPSKLSIFSCQECRHSVTHTPDLLGAQTIRIPQNKKILDRITDNPTCQKLLQT